MTFSNQRNPLFVVAPVVTFAAYDENSIVDSCVGSFIASDMFGVTFLALL